VLAEMTCGPVSSNFTRWSSGGAKFIFPSAGAGEVAAG
jgi:hypothetical protein